MRAIVAAAALAAVLASCVTEPASAGEYTVQACTDEVDRNDALTAGWNGHASVAPATGCLPLAGVFGGLRMGAFTAYADGGYWSLCAPAGTRITGWSASHSSWWYGSGYRRQVDTGPCGGYSLLRADPLPPSPAGESKTGWLDWSGTANAAGIRFTTWCALDPCTGAYGFTELRNLRFRIDDPTPPSLTGPRGLFGQPGWVRGGWDVAFDAADPTGIRTLEAEVDGGEWATQALPCQPDGAITRPNPCEQTAASFARSLDTRALADGEHTLALSASDGGSNRSDPRTHAFRVDNTAPDATARVSGREVTWAVGDTGSGVDGASLAATWSADGGATWRPMEATGWDASSGNYTARLPAAMGDGVARVRLSGADTARPGGNEFASTRSVRVDQTPPVVSVAGAGSPGVPHPGPVTVTLTARDEGSGVQELLWRLDDQPDWTRAGGDEAEARISGSGDHVLRWYAVDRAGNRSAEESRVVSIQAGADGPPPSSADAAGFGDRSASPGTTFTAARRFGPPCPEEATIAADRSARLGDRALLVGFPLPAAPDCQVAEATLRVYATEAGAAPAEAVRAAAAWTPEDADPDTAPGGVGPVATAVAAAPGWVEWDVTAQAGALYRVGDTGLYVRGLATDRPAELTVRFAE